jgi:hypothetical protein
MNQKDFIKRLRMIASKVAEGLILTDRDFKLVASPLIPLSEGDKIYSPLAGVKGVVWRRENRCILNRRMPNLLSTFLP